MALGKFWVLTVQTQFRLRLTGNEATEFKAIFKLASDFDSPQTWWANLGEKGQIVAAPAPPSEMDEILEGASLARYQIGMVLSLRRENPNRVVLQLPREAYRLGVIPDIGGHVAVCAYASGLEFWKAEQWKDDSIKNAATLSAHRARLGG